MTTTRRACEDDSVDRVPFLVAEIVNAWAVADGDQTGIEVCELLRERYAAS